VEVGKDPVEVYKYRKGNYFGEMSLVKNIIWAASVIA